MLDQRAHPASVIVTLPSRRSAAAAVTTPGIVDLIAASQLHIMSWQARLGEIRRSLGSPPPGPGLTAAWVTVAGLINLHMRADDEVCAPALYDLTPRGRALDRESKDAHADIGEMIAETSLRSPGTTSWWQLASLTLAAWSRQSDHEERGRRTQSRRRAAPALFRLGRQWGAFREACIRDWSYPDAPSQLPICQLRLARPATPRLADPAFSPLACTCQACDGKLADIPALRD